MSQPGCLQNLNLRPLDPQADLVGSLVSAERTLSQVDRYPCAQRTLPDMGGNVADWGTDWGTNHGCWRLAGRRPAAEPVATKSAISTKARPAGRGRPTTVVVDDAGRRGAVDDAGGRRRGAGRRPTAG
jgi:formylglycine-generating enzyme required for sulfatase activity